MVNNHNIDHGKNIPESISAEEQEEIKSEPVTLSVEISPEKVRKIAEDHRKGMNMRDMVRKYHYTKEQLSTIINHSHKVVEKEKENSSIDTPKKKGQDKEPMISDEKVQHELFSKFEKEAAGELLPMIKEEFKERFKAGGILLHYDILYRHDLEEIGVGWEEFLDFAFETSYKMLMDVYVKQELEKSQKAETEEMVKEGLKVKTIVQAVENMGK